MSSLESATLTPLVESSTVWPCVLGFIWVAELSTCLPESEFEFSPQVRTGIDNNNGCPVGYYLHMKFRECLRKKYHAQQSPGRIKNWWDSIHNPPKPPPPPPQRIPPRRTTRYDGEWFGYHAGWGSDVSHP